MHKLEKENLKHLSWLVNGRINLMDEAMMRTMADSGCVGIYYGLESGSDDILKQINKGFTAEKAKRVVLQSKKYFGKVMVSFIYGFPIESMADFYDTLFLAIFLFDKGVDVHRHLLSPLPLTPLYERYKDSLSFSQDLISDISWEGSVRSISSEVLGLIKKYPQVFTSFYHFDSPDLLKKKDCVDKTSKQQE